MLLATLRQRQVKKQLNPIKFMLVALELLTIYTQINSFHQFLLYSNRIMLNQSPTFRFMPSSGANQEKWVENHLHF